MVTGEEFTRNAMQRNYSALQDKLRKEEQAPRQTTGVVANKQIEAAA